jgi:hypothetical protein
VAAADSLASSMLAYAEALATFARAGREARLTSSELSTVLGAFERDWQGFIPIPVILLSK